MNKLDNKAANIQMKSCFLEVMSTFKVRIKSFYNTFYVSPVKKGELKEISVEEILHKFFS